MNLILSRVQGGSTEVWFMVRGTCYPQHLSWPPAAHSALGAALGAALGVLCHGETWLEEALCAAVVEKGLTGMLWQSSREKCIS